MTYVYALIALPFGATIGSYATTAGLRWATGRPSTHGRSNCDSCARFLPFTETIPIVSYMVLRGACRTCSASINIGHPIGELLGAATAVLAFLVLPPIEAGLVTSIALALISASMADMRVQRLPDVATARVAVASLGLASLHGWAGLISSVVASVLTLILALMLRWGFVALRAQQGLGLGDVKLMAALALWLGQDIAWAVAWAAMLGLVHAMLLRATDRRIPFGPVLSIAGWSVGLAVQSGLLA